MWHVQGFSEEQWEDLTVETLSELGWEPVQGSAIAPGTDQRDSWDDPVIRPRVLAAMRKLNPSVPATHLQQALADILAPKSQDAITENERFHSWLVGGYRGITYVDAGGSEQNPTIRLIGERYDDNDYLAVRQVTVRSGEHRRRFDIVLYVNGLPLVVIELKKAGSQQADVAAAQAQLRTYVEELPITFRCCVLVVASDGLHAKYGTPFTSPEHFAPWNVDENGDPATIGVPPEDAGDSHLGSGIEYLAEGLFTIERFLQIVRDFTAYDDLGPKGLRKRIAKPHQYFAVTKAVASTIHAVESHGKAGVVWHTQGSGKSMEMELYVHRVMRHPRMLNPTIVVITDRKELDGQLYEGFKVSKLLPEEPKQVMKRSELRDELTARQTGGIYFTTLQKFGRTLAEREAGAEHPLLSDRRNIVVIVDEAHRSHYDDLDGYARHLKDALPNATLIAFTGTPISLAERNTRDVFGEYVDIYDLSRAVEDGATVPVHFEPRLIKVGFTSGLSEDEIDAAADEAVAGLDLAERDRIEKSVAVINAVYGAPERLRALAADIVEHWETRSAAMVTFIEAPGKAMIVGGTREICARLYDEIVVLRPDWHSPDLDKGRIKVVYSGTPSDPAVIRAHVRRDSENKTIKQRLRTVDDELEIVIVKDMMLTGYDSPPLHTLYLDRPLKGALLMQTLARVNRTFRGKEAGLLVAYAPLAENLQEALAEYTQTDQALKPVGKNVDEAVALTERLVGQLADHCAGVAWRSMLDGGGKSWVKAVLATVAYVRSPETRGNRVGEDEATLKERFRQLAGKLSGAWALAGGQKSLGHLKTDVLFYEEVRVYMAKFDAEERRATGQPIPEDIRRLLGQLVAQSTASGEVIDIYSAAGIEKPSLMDLGPDFEDQARSAANPHLAIEALRALLSEESARVAGSSVVAQRAFSERLAELMRRYTNQQLTSAEVIAELIALAKDVLERSKRGETYDPPLKEDELALYDALTQNDSAVAVIEDPVLAQISRELLAVMQRDIKTDWTVRDDVRAKLRSSIKRLLVKYKYPPDKQNGAIQLVIEQMEYLAPRYVA